MTARRLQVLFLVALLGVLAAVGLAVARLTGPAGGAVYAVLAVGLLVVAAGRARGAAAERARATRTCTCCTGSHLDPVRVV